MKHVHKSAVSAVVGLMALSLTACGGSGGSDPKPTSTTAASGKTSATATASASGSAPSTPQQPVPAAFDTTKGWSVTPPADSTLLSRPVIAPADNLLLLLSSTINDTDTGIVAHDVKTGAIRWSGKPTVQLKPVGTPATGADVLVTHKNGKEYAVLASTGTSGGDAVNNGSQVTQLAVYDAASSGEQVAPLRVITVPGLAGGYSALRDGGTVLVRLGRGAAVADVTTGQITTYGAQDATLKPPMPCPLDIGDCGENAKVVGQTPVGPLVQGYTAFWSKAWISNDAAPKNAKPQFSDRTVVAVGTPAGHVVARWPQPTDSTTDVVWALHDGQTGHILATVPCAPGAATAQGTDGVSLSEDGHYLIAGGGIVVFDLQANKGYCFEASSAHKEIDVTAVDTDGTAYGTVGGPQNGAPASVTPGSDQAVALPAGTLVPSLIGAGIGVFGTSTAGGETILVYPHR